MWEAFDDFYWTYQSLIHAIGVNGILALSVYVVLAVGQLSLGQAAFMGVGTRFQICNPEFVAQRKADALAINRARAARARGDAA